MTTYTATYSPDDNKLRLYASTRLDSSTYARVRAAGFIWAPKQDLFVAPMWTPAREDLLLELAGEIDDEDTSLVARAEARAERFEDYSEARAADAESARRAVAAIADGIPLGQPILIGHHSERHARRDADRLENGMRRAVKMWETSEYWTSRAAGAVQHAKYKELPNVRARRIKGLEADARKYTKINAEVETYSKVWRAVLVETDAEKAMQFALHVSNYDHVSRCFTLAEFPRNPPASQYEGPMGLWSALKDGIISPVQAAEIALRVHTKSIAYRNRWLAHTANRLAYERAMQTETGGTATDRKGPEKGGAVRCWASPRGGWSYVTKVNKVSISLLDSWRADGPTFTRTIPFDKITATLTAAEVQAAREAGRIQEAQNKAGFFLIEPPPAEESPAPVPVPVPAPKPDASEFAAMRTALKSGTATTIAVVPQLFPTPEPVARAMVHAADIGEGMHVLEPSAGTGRLLDPLFNAEGTEWRMGKTGKLTVIEVNHALASALRTQYVAADVHEMDFLAYEGELGWFDRIIMNPPFRNGEDIRHIQHALRFLRPGGRLVALCADGPRQRAALQPLATVWQTLPYGTFSETGTQVNVAMFVIVTEPTVSNGLTENSETAA